MDAEGARSLRWRIEEQQHWRQAAAVNDGRQPATDPDGVELESLGEGIRRYKPRVMHGRVIQFCKRIVDGIWEVAEIDAASDSSLDPAPAPSPELVKVA